VQFVQFDLHVLWRQDESAVYFDVVLSLELCLLGVAEWPAVGRSHSRGRRRKGEAE
jgi:hypothetical protein